MADTVRAILVIEQPTGERRYIGPYRSLHAAERDSVQHRAYCEGEKWWIEPLEKASERRNADA